MSGHFSARNFKLGHGRQGLVAVAKEPQRLYEVAGGYLM